MLLIRIILNYILTIMLRVSVLAFSIVERFGKFSFARSRFGLVFSRFSSLSRNFSLENRYLIKISFFLFRLNIGSDRFFRYYSGLYESTNCANLNSLGLLQKENVLKQVENFSVKKNSFQGKKTSSAQGISFFHGKQNVFRYLVSDSMLSYNNDMNNDFLRYLNLFQSKEDKIKEKLSYKNKAHENKMQDLEEQRELIKSLRRSKKGKKTGAEFSKKVKKFPINGGLKIFPALRKKRENPDLYTVDQSYLPSIYNLPPAPVGPYGVDVSLYNRELASKDKKTLGRRLGSFETVGRPVVNGLGDFSLKVGYVNSSLFESEGTDNDISIPLDTFQLGRFYIVNPFLVISYLVYSVLELLLLFYFLAKVTGSPFALFSFFLKYNMAYYYQNLVAFPSVSFIFGSLIIWFWVFVIFLLHILEIIDEDKFVPFNFSWFTVFVHQLLYNLIVISVIFFFCFEFYNFLNLLFTRILFFGSVGHPQFFNILYLFFLDLYRILSSFNYFSFFLENFFSFRTNTITYAFGDFMPFPLRKSFVQPDFLLRSGYSAPNFFVWVCAKFLDYFYIGDFGTVQHRVVFRRELIQDIRKYNYLRWYWAQLELVGQLYSRGYNGQNYRLDLEIFKNTSILADSKNNHFDWRLKEKMPHFTRQLVQIKPQVVQSLTAHFSTNFEPSYYLYPAVNLTTFSAFHGLSRVTLGRSPAAVYPFGLLFSGFDKINSLSFPFKFIGFDYSAFYNSNFFASLYSRYRVGQLFRSLDYLTPKFFNISNDVSLYGEDFFYPVLSQFRLKEKLFPIDFYLFKKNLAFFNYNCTIFSDPYFAIYKNFFNPSSYFYLDLKVQNWLDFMNVMWNQHYHFFYKRSYRSDGNGSVFRFSGGSYKLFIGSSTLQHSYLGQYFYNYLSWLQYKFRWLLYPSASYKRFDAHRVIQNGFSKKFYYSSLLKFYQVQLYRWQLAAKSYQSGVVQSRNFLLHLLFLKQAQLEILLNFRRIFTDVPLALKKGASVESPLDFTTGLLGMFNRPFFELRDQSTVGLVTRGSFYLPQSGKAIGDYSRLYDFESMGSVPKKLNVYLPILNFKDFRIFQYVLDLRRYNALQSVSVRLWNFDHYLRYLGPLMHRSDVTSLFGFFAPFEYRNQIFVSRLRKDSMRFSVFFPVKSYNEVRRLRARSPVAKILRGHSVGIDSTFRKSFSSRAISRGWQIGQGWLKYVVPQTLNSANHRKHTLFNFGIFGIGRLPRLSRSYFHMLFFRNKIQDFVQLKSSFIKLQLMALPFFSIYSRNRSFNLFWSYFLMSQSRGNSIRYVSIFQFSNFDSFKQLRKFLVAQPSTGYLFGLSTRAFSDSSYINLWNQYSAFSIYDKFLFFNDYYFPLKMTTGSLPGIDKSFTGVSFSVSDKVSLTSSFAPLLSGPIQFFSFKSTLHWYFYPVAYFSFVAMPLFRVFQFTLTNITSPLDTFFSSQFEYYAKFLNFLFFNRTVINLKNFSFGFTKYWEAAKPFTTNFLTSDKLFFEPFIYSAQSPYSRMAYCLSNPFLVALNSPFFRFSSSFFLVDNFLNFESNLFIRTKSLDGSGRFTRPKGLLSRFDQIFTYREFEKFRREHHRQRFRGVFPYWVQRASRKVGPRYLGNSHMLRFLDVPNSQYSFKQFSREFRPTKFSLLQKYMKTSVKPDRGSLSKKFVRGYSYYRKYDNVSLFIPYRYSKWYFQNPRLNMIIPTKFIDIYVNNHFSELKEFYIQSLFLLKRKIMFDVFSLNLSAQRRHVLYFSVIAPSFIPLDLNTGFIRSLWPVMANGFLDRLVAQFSESLLVFYFLIFDFSSLSILPSSNFLAYLISLRSASVANLFLSANYIRLLYNPVVARYLHKSDFIDSSITNNFYLEKFSEKLAAKRVFSYMSLRGRSGGHPLGFYNFGFRGEYAQFFDGKFRRYSLVNFYRQQLGLRKFKAVGRRLDNIYLNNVFVDSDQTLLRGNEGYAVTKRRAWRYLPFRIISPVPPFSKKVSSLSSVSRLDHEHLFSFLRLMKYSSDNYVTLPVKLRLFFFKHGFLINDRRISLSQNLTSFFCESAIVDNKGGGFLFNKQLPSYSNFLSFAYDSEKKLMNLSFFSNEYNRSVYHQSKSINRRWKEFRINPYHSSGWQSFLHKIDEFDFMGTRRYKLNSSNDSVFFSSQQILKSFSLRHILLAQLPSNDLTGLGRFPLKATKASSAFLDYYNFNKHVFDEVFDLGYNRYSINQLFSLYSERAGFIIGSRLQSRVVHFPSVFRLPFLLYGSSLPFNDAGSLKQDFRSLYRFYGRCLIYDIGSNFFFPFDSKVQPWLKTNLDKSNFKRFWARRSIANSIFLFSPEFVKDFKSLSLSKRLSRVFYGHRLSFVGTVKGYTSYLKNKSSFDIFSERNAPVAVSLFGPASVWFKVSNFYTDLNSFFYSDLMDRARLHYPKQSLLDFYYVAPEMKHTTSRGFTFLRSKHVLQPVKLEHISHKKSKRSGALYFPLDFSKRADIIFRSNYAHSTDIRPSRRVKNLMILTQQFSPYARFVLHSRLRDQRDASRPKWLVKWRDGPTAFYPPYKQSSRLTNSQTSFDYNGYKQRYNIGLLFRGLLFESDLGLFRARKRNLSFFFFPFIENFNFASYKSFLFNGNGKVGPVILGSSTFAPSVELLSGDRDLSFFRLLFSGDRFWLFCKFVYKLSFHYIFILFVDLYLNFAFTLFVLFVWLYKFDFSYYFTFSFSNSFFGSMERSFFGFWLFHLGVFRNYLQFLWFFKLRFLLFNLDYFNYYFFLIFLFLYFRGASDLNLKKDSSSFFPYIWRISDELKRPYNFNNIFLHSNFNRMLANNKYNEDEWFAHMLKDVLNEFQHDSLKASTSSSGSLRFIWPFLDVKKQVFVSSPKLNIYDSTDIEFLLKTVQPSLRSLKKKLAVLPSITELRKKQKQVKVSSKKDVKSSEEQILLEIREREGDLPQGFFEVKRKKKEPFNRKSPETFVSFLRLASRAQPSVFMYPTDKLLEASNTFDYRSGPFSFGAQEQYFDGSVSKVQEQNRLRDQRIVLPAWLDGREPGGEGYILGLPETSSRIHYVMDVPSEGRLGSSFSKTFSKFYTRQSLWKVKDSSYFVFNSDFLPDTFDEFLRFFSRKLHLSYRVNSAKDSLLVDPGYVKLLLLFNRIKRLSAAAYRVNSRYQWSNYSFDDGYGLFRPATFPVARTEMSTLVNLDNLKFWSYVAGSSSNIFPWSGPPGEKSGFWFFLVNFFNVAYIYGVFFLYLLFLIFVFCLFFLLIFFFLDYLLLL